MGGVIYIVIHGTSINFRKVHVDVLCGIEITDDGLVHIYPC